MKIIKRDNNANNAVYTPVRSIFDDFFTLPSIIEDSYFDSSFRNISADMWEEKDAVFVKMAIPGVKEEDLKVTVENDFITISANTKKEEKDENDKKYYYKSMSSSFQQTFNLPCKVDVDSSEARLENGVVTIKLPKSKEQIAREVKIVK